MTEHGAKRALARAIATAKPPRRQPLLVSGAERRAQLADLGVDLVLLGEPGYPPRLASIADPPAALFLKGGFLEVPTVAVVGTRRCTAYGRSLAREYGGAIASAGWAVVSGLARGIDAAAHRGTVAAAGSGIAVLGSGIDVMYPREHASLAADLIAGGGAVCTEYPPGTRPDGWRFPLRNRIIVGLAQAVVVVEAAKTGGALITATLAMETGVPVFVVPGDVGRSAAEGSNRLIRDGAHPVLEPEDLIDELSLVVGPPRSQTRVVRVGLAASVPAGGIAVDDLATLVGSDMSVVLAEIASAELDGLVRTEGDLVFRA
jgi:DNA processing protein